MLDPMDPYPQIPFGNTRNLRNFRIGNFIEHHRNDNPLMFFQLCDGPVKGRHLLGLFRILFCMIFDNMIIQFLGWPAFGGTEMGKTGIDGNPVNPGGHLGLVPEFVQILPDLDKGFLHQVVGGIGITGITIA